MSRKTKWNQTAIFFGILCTALPIGCAKPAGGPAKVEVEGVRNLYQDGDVYIAGTPTAQGLRTLKERGVTAVIDLRTDEEISPAEREAAQTVGLTYIQVPMKSDGLADDQAETFLRQMKAHEKEKVLVHCAGGNRAGAMYGLYLGRTGRCSADEAILRAKRAGLRNEKLEVKLRERLKDKQEAQKLRPNP